MVLNTKKRWGKNREPEPEIDAEVHLSVTLKTTGAAKNWLRANHIYLSLRIPYSDFKPKSNSESLIRVESYRQTFVLMNQQQNSSCSWGKPQQTCSCMCGFTLRTERGLGDHFPIKFSVVIKNIQGLVILLCVCKETEASVPSAAGLLDSSILISFFFTFRVELTSLWSLLNAGDSSSLSDCSTG